MTVFLIRGLHFLSKGGEESARLAFLRAIDIHDAWGPQTVNEVLEKLEGSLAFLNIMKQNGRVDTAYRPSKIHKLLTRLLLSHFYLEKYLTQRKRPQIMKAH